VKVVRLEREKDKESEFNDSVHFWGSSPSFVVNKRFLKFSNDTTNVGIVILGLRQEQTSLAYFIFVLLATPFHAVQRQKGKS
jgi:hypothetical protein